MILHPRHAIVLLLLSHAAPALAQAPQCAGFPAGANVHACSCGPGPHTGAVWGSGPYTADSDLCTAATHAGVIGPEGGQVIAMGVVPPASYTGTQANGVASSDWGTYDTAYVFYGGTERAGVRVCGPLGPEPVTTCTCEAGRPQGAVWGSGPYTDDSDVCTAAMHAGAIGPQGGEVTVQRVDGQDAYRGSTANGVTTSDYGSWPGSFTFGG